MRERLVYTHMSGKRDFSATEDSLLERGSYEVKWTNARYFEKEVKSCAIRLSSRFTDAMRYLLTR